MDPLATLALKLAVTPVLIAVASLAGRRWGPELGGWLVGIPFTSGPIALFLALDRGRSFAADAAAGILAGTASQAVFCLAYSWVATSNRESRGWPQALAAGSVAFLAATALLEQAVWPLPLVFVLMLAALLLALRLMPRPEPAAAGAVTFPAWDLPARMVVATAFVLALTSAAPLLGPRLAGLIAPYPVYASVLAIFAQRIHGPSAGAGVLRGLLLGLFAFASFFFVVSALLTSRGIVLAFGAAVLVAVAVQGSTLALRRLRAA